MYRELKWAVWVAFTIYDVEVALCSLVFMHLVEKSTPHRRCSEENPELFFYIFFHVRSPTKKEETWLNRFGSRRLFSDFC